jgi:hypothetical protein
MGVRVERAAMGVRVERAAMGVRATALLSDARAHPVGAGWGAWAREA